MRSCFCRDAARKPGFMALMSGTTRRTRQALPHWRAWLQEDCVSGASGIQYPQSRGGSWTRSGLVTAARRYASRKAHLQSSRAVAASANSSHSNCKAACRARTIPSNFRNPRRICQDDLRCRTQTRRPDRRLRRPAHHPHRHDQAGVHLPCNWSARTR